MIIIVTYFAIHNNENCAQNYTHVLWTWWPKPTSIGITYSSYYPNGPSISPPPPYPKRLAQNQMPQQPLEVWVR